MIPGFSFSRGKGSDFSLTDKYLEKLCQKSVLIEIFALTLRQFSYCPQCNTTIQLTSFNQFIQIMKKSFLSLLLMFVSVMVLNAQSLTAHQWGTKLTDDDGKDVLVALAFDKNGACELLVGAEHQIKEDGVPITITGSVTVPGTYTLNGKDLTMDLNKGQAEVDFDYEIKGMDAKTKKLMDKQIRSDLNVLKGEFMNTMLNGMPKMHNMKIVKLTNKELTLQIDNGKEMPFYAL